MDREVYERLAALETLVAAQSELLGEIKKDVRALITFRAALLGVSAFVSAVVGIVVSLFKN